MLVYGDLTGDGDGDDGGLDGADAIPSKPPRPLAPLSTSRVTSRQPTLRWALPPGIRDATIDLCSDRACTRPIGGSVHVTGTSYAPTSPLPTGVVYWRVHPATDTALTSPTWQLTVGAGSAPVDTSWGTTLDVNGDGYADVAISAIDTAMTETALVYLGGAGGLATTPAATLTVPDGLDHDFTQSVASAGDVNGDGYADLIVGATGSDYAFVYPGGATGVATSPASTLPRPAGFGYDWFASTAAAGDVNGDGYADVLVVLSDDRGGVGYACVYLGSATGLATTPAVTFNAPGGGNFWVDGATAGDVNGDGYGDVVIGTTNTGSAYVYVGSASGLGTTPATTLGGPAGSSGFGLGAAGAGDVNGDGYADVIVGAPNSANAYVYLGGSAGIATTPSITLSGGYDSALGDAVASAGDVNGDGYADVVVGANGGQSATIYLGSAKGLTTMPATTLTGVSASDFGYAVASAGDVNGDGYSDVIVGARHEQDITGRAYFYVGGPSGIGSTATTTLLDGDPRDELFGGSVFGATN